MAVHPLLQVVRLQENLPVSVFERATRVLAPAADVAGKSEVRLDVHDGI
ncbi:MAG: hypothetical protein ACXWC0_26000 [Burkholderiales bacterium]